MIPISKELLKSGDKVLFHTKGFSLISFGIRMLTESFFNHVGGYVEEVDLKGYVIEALGKGVVKTPIEQYLNNKNYILKVVRLKREAFKHNLEYEQGLETSRQRLYERIGQKYDWGSIVWLGIKYIIKGYWNKGAKYIPKQYNPFNSRYKVFCSELICQCDYGISSQIKNLYAGKKYLNATCSTITPHDIAKSQWIEYIAGIDKL
jgi:hypothetical protein